MSGKSDKKENLEPKHAFIPSFLVNKLTASSGNSKSSGKQLGADICTFAPGEKISREDGERSATETSLLQCIRLVDQSAKKIKDGEKGTIYR